MIKLAAQGSPVEASIRHRRLIADMRLPGVVVAEFQGWVGACTVRYRLGDAEHADVISSVDEAFLVAGMLSAPLAGANSVRVEPATSGQADFRTALDWGRARLGEVDLAKSLAWWSL
ncbi:hypothetical protein ACOAM9_27190 [Pseudomonas aeruginosa]|uniref:hypothetical protein n=1 Tax=Pseudomonas aeruginosa TaxID=287 RepID=UPI001DBED8D3|nr:hypothetical protein [Pseudomonas aeruginosa]MBN0748348.1 hypothetical protein [Pseudomonas aeruginosa]MCT0357068.1 hypothetical protein [Pseudomonas aeruginosa]MCT0387384.1 hypothetical protein [Pseudomonas aeruginosa]MDY1346695.1 hypothetical protein [Pseudomonas aeruginosa]HBO8818642.1 hypothetical protein [Pseudomonas aeruginosa]